MLMITINVFAQNVRTLNPRLFQKIARSDTAVKYQIIKNGSVIKTDTSKVNNIAVPVNEKLVMQYGSKILSASKDSGKVINLPAFSQFAKTGLKVIPEVHIGNIGTRGEKIAYQIAFTENQKFRYIDSLARFCGKLNFLLISATNPKGNLGEPEKIEVHSDEVITIDPDKPAIAHLNEPSTEIHLTGDRVSDSVKIKIITESNATGYTTFIGVEPTLQIFTNDHDLQGFGIDKIPISVRIMGSTSSDSLKVNFTASKGTMTPNALYVKYNAPATVYLRSANSGDCIVSAHTSNMNSNNLVFTYTFPWVFLLASVLGGLIGAFARYYFNAGEKKFSMRPIIGGVLVGFIVAAAYYALGINLIGLDFSAELNEVTVLALSALGAYIGITRK